MNIFIVHKEGVYRHECGGVFSSLELAIAACKQIHTGDRDDYHSYEVRQHVLDVATEQNHATDEDRVHGGPYRHGGDLVEGEALFSIGGGKP